MILLSFKHCKVLQLNYCWKAEKNKTKISLWCDKINRIILKSACNLSCLLSHALLSLQECFSRILLMSKKWLNIPSYHSAELFIRVKLLCWATFTWWLQSKTKHCAFFLLPPAEGLLAVPRRWSSTCQVWLLLFMRPHSPSPHSAAEMQVGFHYWRCSSTSY